MNEMNDDDWHDGAMADEARALAELDARQAAMPLRRMVGIKWSENGKRWEFWELECGHSLPCSVRLGDNGCVRCYVCYAVGMERAEKMLEPGR
jgi:hypothetical protein